MVFFKHDGVITFLERFFDSDKRLVQNLLFWGEESVGKMTTAKVFSETLLCNKNPRSAQNLVSRFARNKKEAASYQQKSEKWGGCEECDSCRMLKKGFHPDLMVIEPEENSVKIEQIRQGLDFLLYHPQISSLKILIVNKADKMTEDSQNAFLKTLEEPRDNNLVILITNSPSKLLETVRSRLLSLRFTRKENKKLVDFLQKEHSLSAAEAEEITNRADGKIGKVMKLLNKDYRKELDEKREDLLKMLNENFAKQSIYFQNLAEDSEKLKSTLEEWLRVLRSDKNSAKLNLTPEKRIKLMTNILKAIYLITDTNINKQLLMENIFLQL